MPKVDKGDSFEVHYAFKEEDQREENVFPVEKEDQSAESAFAVHSHLSTKQLEERTIAVCLALEEELEVSTFAVHCALQQFINGDSLDAQFAACERMLDPAYLPALIGLIPQLVHLMLCSKRNEVCSIERVIIQAAQKSVRFLCQVCWYLHCCNRISLTCKAEAAFCCSGRLLNKLLFIAQHGTTAAGIGKNCAVALAGIGCMIGAVEQKSVFVPQLERMVRDMREVELNSFAPDFDSGCWLSVDWEAFAEGAAFLPNRNNLLVSVENAVRFANVLEAIGEELLLLQPNNATFVGGEREKMLSVLLHLLNANLPAVIPLPFSSGERTVLLRVPPEEATVLHSAERVPCMICVEVLEEAEQGNCGESRTEKSQEPLISLAANLNSAIEIQKNCIKLNPALIMLAQMLSRPDSSAELKLKMLAEIPLEPNSKASSAHTETWSQKCCRIRKSSPFGHLPNWNLYSFIVKSNADLRQEQLAIQLIDVIRLIFEKEKVDCWLSPAHRIIVTCSNGGGWVETIQETSSIHCIKQRTNRCTLLQHFISTFGSPSEQTFQLACIEFMRSFVAYSLICWLFQVKDRHNGNILIDLKGHLIHIDFGFFLCNAPGRLLAVESAPFKLTEEYVELLESCNLYLPSKQLFLEALTAVRRNFNSFSVLIEALGQVQEAPSPLPPMRCLQRGVTNLLGDLRDRLMLSAGQEQILRERVDQLFASSRGNSFTRMYDTYQYYANGIL